MWRKTAPTMSTIIIIIMKATANHTILNVCPRVYISSVYFIISTYYMNKSYDDVVSVGSCAVVVFLWAIDVAL